MKSVAFLLLTAAAIAQPSGLIRNRGGRKDRRQPQKENQCFDLFKGSFLASRLWTSAPDACKVTPEHVLAEFANGFAPEIRVLDGFEEYVGAVQTSDTERFDRSYFYNFFETPEQAEAANVLARDFVASSRLLRGNVVNPSEDPADAQFAALVDFWSSRSCAPSKTGNSGRFLSTRLWKSTEVSGQTIVDEFRKGFRGQIQGEAGFQMYMGAVVDAKTAYFMNVFDTQEQAEMANAKAAEFIQMSKLDGRITLARATTNLIGFDIFSPPGSLVHRSSRNGQQRPRRYNRGHASLSSSSRHN